MKSILKDLINFLYPAECHLCGVKLAPHEDFTCSACLDSFTKTGYHLMPLNPMEERFAGQFPFEKATGLFFYSKGSPLSQLIQDMKYRSFPGIGVMLGKMAAKELFPTGFFNDMDFIAPVPMHFLKKAARGYNQAERIAYGLSRELSLSLIEPLVMCKRRKSQAGLKLEERLRNADNLFKSRNGMDLNNKGVLLIDDICTTGTTIAAAARTLTEKYPSIRLKLLTIGVTF